MDTPPGSSIPAAGPSPSSSTSPSPAAAAAAMTSPAPDSAEHKEIWDANAASWDAAIGDTGNTFYRHLVAPTALSLLALRPADNILELACGNGLFARRMCAAHADVRVLATDFSPAMLAAARARTSAAERERIFYRALDVTSERELDGLVALSGKHWGFDAIVCNMALMDLPDLAALAFALPRLLKSGGRFVATIMHPAFNSSGAHRALATADDPHAPGAHCVHVGRYLDIPPTSGKAVAGQSRAQYYYHRPLAEVLRPFLERGLVLDGFEEPAFRRDAEKGARKGRELSWMNYSQIPPVLGFRLRKGRDLE
ncbi:methyltransferase type 11 [Geopyxis carbonaria]|nr:methyltransferase type 11 [Geopyxis carbonaria]